MHFRRGWLTALANALSRSRSRGFELAVATRDMDGSAARRRFANSIQCSNGHSLIGALALMDKWIDLSGTARFAPTALAASGNFKTEARRLQRKSAYGQELPALLINGQTSRRPRDPIGSNPTVPKMLAIRLERQRVGSANEGHRENAAIGTCEIEKRVEALGPQRAQDVQMFPPWRAFFRKRDGPGFIDAPRQFEHFRANRRRKCMKFRRGVMSLDFPKRRRQVN